MWYLIFVLYFNFKNQNYDYKKLLRYGYYQILAADNVSLSVSATLRELNTSSCPGREYHNGLLQISRNAIDADADMYNNNLNNTLHEDVNVSIKELLADDNKSSLRDEVVSLIWFFSFVW